MKKTDRYDVSSLTEAQFQSNSNETVLKNLKGITDVKAMDIIEARLLGQATDQLIHRYDESHSFMIDDILCFHKLWLSDVYEWAGQYRKVNISKDDFHFAMAEQIPSLMNTLEKDIFNVYTPCCFKGTGEIIRALSIVHVELILIHPFRDGNGRVARLLASLMALQAGLPLLDFKGILGDNKQTYFVAIQAGLDRDYQAMETVFKSVIEQTLSAY